MKFVKHKILAGLYAVGFLSKMARKDFSRFIKRYASKGKTLDVGSAQGPYKNFFPNRVSTDIVAGEGVAVVADVHSLPFKDGEFETVLCTEALEHFYNPFQAVAEMRRVLKKGGTLILTTRFIFPLHETPHDYFRFTEYGLRHLLKDFEILQIERDGGTIETLAVLLQRIGYQCDTLYFKPFKLFWFLAAKVVAALPNILTKQYGEINQRTPVSEIMTAGYFVAARK